MADVRPFNAVTYDPVRVPDAGLVTCPPYDVISPADRDMLYDRHPYNVVRIVSGREEPGDDDGAEQVHARVRLLPLVAVGRDAARGPLPRRCSCTARRSTTRPGKLRRVWGMFATISLDDEILAHEKTMSGPKADRLALMHAIPANLSPIYALYREEGGAVSRDLSSWSNERPSPTSPTTRARATRCGPCTTRRSTRRSTAALAPSPAADRRRPPSLRDREAYRDERRAADGPGPWDHIMTLLVDVGTAAAVHPSLPPDRAGSASTDDPMAVDRRAASTSPRSALADEATVRAFEHAPLGRRPRIRHRSSDDTLYRLEAPADASDEIPAGVLARARARTARHHVRPRRACPSRRTASTWPQRPRSRRAARSAAFLIPPVERRAGLGTRRRRRRRCPRSRRTSFRSHATAS